MTHIGLSTINIASMCDMSSRKRFLHKALIIALLFGAPLLTGCGNGESKENPEAAAAAPAQAREADRLLDVVTTMRVEPQTFYMEIISAGRIEAGERLPLVFEHTGKVKKVLVQNGQSVAQGQAIAELDPSEIDRSIARKKIDCEESEISLRDILIGQGYSYENKEEIPEKQLQLALLKSGYLRNKNDMEDLMLQKEQSVLRAPFAGVVANLNIRPGETIGNGGVCEIIGRSGMEVVFPVLPNEIGMIRNGQPVGVKIIGDSREPLSGRVLSINPVINDKGQIEVTASVQPDHALIPGMSVSVSVKEAIANQLVLPKTAVVERSGRKVVFTVKDDKAYWHYVTLGLQNSTSYTVTDGLEAGEEVVTSGAQNLSDGITVIVQNDDTEDKDTED